MKSERQARFDQLLRDYPEAASKLYDAIFVDAGTEAWLCEWCNRWETADPIDWHQDCPGVPFPILYRRATNPS